VLVVEDDSRVRDVLRDSLESDYGVATAADGASALHAFQHRPVDAVLLDLRLPGVGGLDILRRMKAIDPRVEIILVTAIDEIPTVVEGMQAGAFDYVTKPFSIDRLLATVARVVERRARGGEIVLVGRGIGWPMALQVFVERTLATVVSLSADAAVNGLGGRHPRLIVVDCPPHPAATTDLIKRLRVRYEGCRFLAIASDRAVAARLRQSGALAPSAIVAGSPHLDVILGRMATELASVTRRRVAMPRLHPAVVAAAEYVSRDHRETLRAGDLARAAGVATFELGRAFRESIGITAKDFVTRFRVSAACYALVDGKNTLEHVAALTGFQDASHLSRVFTRQLGVRPGEYRRRVTGGETAYFSVV